MRHVLLDEASNSLLGLHRSIRVECEFSRINVRHVFNQICVAQAHHCFILSFNELIEESLRPPLVKLNDFDGELLAFLEWQVLLGLQSSHVDLCEIITTNKCSKFVVTYSA